MHEEQIQKIRDYLLANGQQELVGHLDLLINERNSLKAEALPVADTPLNEGEAPEETPRVSAQAFQDNAKKDVEGEKHPSHGINMDGSKPKN
jgi:hypothetical protein